MNWLEFDLVISDQYPNILSLITKSNSNLFHNYIQCLLLLICKIVNRTQVLMKISFMLYFKNNLFVL